MQFSELEYLLNEGASLCIQLEQERPINHLPHVERNLIKEKPDALAFLVCDQIITDAQSSKKTLVGLFNKIVALRLPAVHPSLVVFLALSGAKGDYDARLRMVQEGVDSPSFELIGKISFPDPLHVVEMSFILRNVRFEEAGIYNFEFYCDDELVQTRRFEVVLRQNPSVT